MLTKSHAIKRLVAFPKLSSYKFILNYNSCKIQYICFLIQQQFGTHLSSLDIILEMPTASPLYVLDLCYFDPLCYRYGSADLCYSHTRLLLEICSHTGYTNCSVQLNKRLIKFLAPEHQVKLCSLLTLGRYRLPLFNSSYKPFKLDNMLNTTTSYRQF